MSKQIQRDDERAGAVPEKSEDGLRMIDPRDVAESSPVPPEILRPTNSVVQRDDKENELGKSTSARND